LQRLQPRSKRLQRRHVMASPLPQNGAFLHAILVLAVCWVFCLGAVGEQETASDASRLAAWAARELHLSEQDATSFASRFPWVLGPLKTRAPNGTAQPRPALDISERVEQWRRRRLYRHRDGETAVERRGGGSGGATGLDDDDHDSSNTEASPVRFTFKQLHGASLREWSRAKALMAGPSPAVVILDPADGSVLVTECSGGTVSPHCALRIRVDFNTGEMSAADLEHAPAEAARYSVVLNGEVIVDGLLFRKCPASAEAWTGDVGGLRSDGRHICDTAVNPQGTLSPHQTQYFIAADVSFACPAEHMVVVNLSLLPPFPPEEINAWAHFSLAGRRTRQTQRTLDPVRPGVKWPEPVPAMWFDGIFDAKALRIMNFETYSDVCGSDGALAHGRRVVDHFAGFSYDYAVVHCLLRRHAPPSGVLLEIGTNDGSGLLVLAQALQQACDHNRSEMSQQRHQTWHSLSGWRLLTLDLPECLEPSHNASSAALDAASLSVCVRGMWQDRRKNVGARARQEHLVFTQLWGDSLSFDFAALGTVDVWWIDGAHDYAHCHRETTAAVRAGASLILYHDAAAFADAEGASVLRAALDALKMSATVTTSAATDDMPDTAASDSASFSLESEGENKMSSAPLSGMPLIYSVHVVYDTRIVYAHRVKNE